jgi:hypothetical protein
MPDVLMARPAKIHVVMGEEFPWSYQSFLFRHVESKNIS